MSETAVPESRPSRKRLVLVLGVLTLVVMAAGGWWAFGLAAADEPPPDVDGEIVQLEPLTTTLGQRSIQHARVTLAVVLTLDGDPEDITPRVPLLNDALLREVASMDADGVRSSEGSERLRDRLTAEAQAIWGEEVVRRVVLTELLVQ